MKEFDVENDEGAVVSVDDEFGQGKGKQRKQFEAVNYFTFKNGDNVFRILPEMFTAKEKGLWAVYHARHWGYKNAKGKQQPFACVRKFDTKTRLVSHECGFCKDQEKHKAAVDATDAKVKALRVNIKDAEEAGDLKLVATLETQLAPAVEALTVARRAYMPQERKFWVNAMSPSGEFGILALPKTVYEQLQGKRDNNTNVRSKGIINLLEEEEGINALDVNEGVWFNIRRTGEDQFNTEYQVVVQTERVEIEGKKYNRPKSAPLSQEQKQTAVKKCRDLIVLFDHTILDDEKIKLVVAGTPEMVSAIADAPRQVNTPVKLDDSFGSQTAKAIPRGAPMTDDEILAMVRGQA